MTTVCRVCLIGGGKVMLCSLEDVRLRDVYKKLTTTQFHSEDGRPRVVCSLCYRNLLRCWTLSEMACKSENIISNLLFKGIEATHETIEDLNLGTKQRLAVAPVQLIDLKDEIPKNSSVIYIKEEPISVKEVPISVKEVPISVKEVPISVKEVLILLKEEPISVKEEETETIEKLNQGTNLHLMQTIDNETPKNSSAIIIKEDPISVKEEETVQVDELVDTESDGTLISEECIKSEMIFEEHCENENYFIESSTEMNYVTLKLETETEKLDSDQEQSQIQEVEIHPDKLKTYCCDICRKMFLLRSRLVSHIQLSHAKEQQQKAFDKKLSDLHTKRPKRKHTGDNPIASSSLSDKQFNQKSNPVKPYSCSKCDKEFNQKHHLVTHMRIHTGEKPFVCSVCDKQFHRNSNLVRHMRVHTGLKPFACSTCDKQFKQKHHLVSHMRIHTGEKPYSCTKCDKQFHRSSNLIRHMKVHIGVKLLYDCNICDKQFNLKSSLVTHLRIHTGVKPYACNICAKQFTLKSSLVTHVKIHTGVKLNG